MSTMILQKDFELLLESHKKKMVIKEKNRK